MHSAIQSAYEAVLSSYQSFFSDDECEGKENVTAENAATSSGLKSDADSTSDENVSSTGVASAKMPWDASGGEDEEGLRVKAAFSALLREPTRGPRDKVAERPLAIPVVTPIRHCFQYETWDCGIACLVMVMRWLREGGNTTHRPEISDQYGGTASLTHRELLERSWMIDSVDTESVWTIDLVILLEHILGRETREGLEFPGGNLGDWSGVSASYLFCSTKLGVDESYNRLGYYKHAFQNDEVRVTNRFQLAKELGLPTLCVTRLDLSAVVDVVSRPNCIAIVLVDNVVLLNPQADSKTAQHQTELANGHSDASLHVGVEAEMCGDAINLVPSDVTELEPQGVPHNHEVPSQQSTEDSSYAGHYVVLCGVSSEPAEVAYAEGKREGLGSSFCMVIKNPSSRKPTDFVTPAHFERAWRANGTDDDIIFIANWQRK